MARIVVELPANRNQAGTLRLEDRNGVVIAGPFPVLGRAANNLPERPENPTRDPLQPFGDTPAGEWAVDGWQPTGEGTGRSLYSYGPHGAITMRGAAGDALTAQNNGRTGIWIHGGAPGAQGGESLRPTAGCLRLSNNNMQALIQAIATLVGTGTAPPGEAVVQEGIEVSVTEVDLDAQINEPDPPGEPGNWGNLPPMDPPADQLARIRQEMARAARLNQVQQQNNLNALRQVAQRQNVANQAAQQALGTAARMERALAFAADRTNRVINALRDMMNLNQARQLERVAQRAQVDQQAVARAAQERQRQQQAQREREQQEQRRAQERAAVDRQQQQQAQMQARRAEEQARRAEARMDAAEMAADARQRQAQQEEARRAEQQRQEAERARAAEQQRQAERQRQQQQDAERRQQAERDRRAERERADHAQRQREAQAAQQQQAAQAQRQQAVQAQERVQLNREVRAAEQQQGIGRINLGRARSITTEKPSLFSPEADARLRALGGSPTLAQLVELRLAMLGGQPT